MVAPRLRFLDTARVLELSSPITKRHHLCAVALFVAVIILVFNGAIFRGEVLAPLDLLSKELPWQAVVPRPESIQNFTLVDVFAVFQPWKHFVHDELRAGRFPLWCTHVGCGYPLAGEGVIKLFGLTTLFLWFSPPRVACILTYSTQLFIALTGMYVLLCSLRMRWASAVFGALVYGLNTSMFQFLEYEHMTGGLMMLPWMCWALWRAVQGGGKFVALAGLFFGLTIINGSLQSSAIVELSAASFTAAAAWRRQRARFVRSSLATIAAFSVLGLAVGAIALFPNLELFAHNARGRFNRVNWWQLTWKRPLGIVPAAAAIVNPDAIGNYQTFDIARVLGTVGSEATTPKQEDLRVYCGLTALLLAGLGLRGRSEARNFGLVLVVVPVLVAVFTPLFLILYFRALSSVACGVAVLAALGLERFWLRDESLARDLKVATVLLVVAIGLTLVAGAAVSIKRAAITKKLEEVGPKRTSVYKADTAWQLQKARETVRNFTLGGRAVARFSVLAAILALALCVGRQPVAIAVVLLAINSVDLMEFGRRTVPSVPQTFEYPVTPGLEFLQRQEGKFRVASTWNMETEPPTARANLLMLYNLDDPRVYESLFPPNPLLKAQDWSGLNVKYFVVPPGAAPPTGEWRSAWRGEVDIYENPHVEPRLCFTTDLISITAEPTAVEILTYRSGEITAQVDAPRAGWLVVREMHYPGWQAFVNERPANIERASGQWQAVAVAAGRNEVRLVYRPVSVRCGAAVSAGGLVVVVWFWRRRAR